MEQYIHYFVKCKNDPGCGQPIWLPSSIPLGTCIAPRGMPTDEIPRIFVCPACDHAFDYTPAEYRHELRPQPDQYQQGLLFRGTIEFSCEAESCGVRTRIRRPVDVEEVNGSLWHENAETWTIDALCPEQHRVTQIPLDYEHYLEGWW